MKLSVRHCEMVQVRMAARMKALSTVRARTNARGIMVEIQMRPHQIRSTADPSALVRFDSCDLRGRGTLQGQHNQGMEREERMCVIGGSDLGYIPDEC